MTDDTQVLVMYRCSFVMYVYDLRCGNKPAEQNESNAQTHVSWYKYFQT